MKKIKIGQHIDLTLKPMMMKDWVLIRETKKCLVVRKTFKQRYGSKHVLSGCNYIPKKTILKVEVK